MAKPDSNPNTLILTLTKLKPGIALRIQLERKGEVEAWVNEISKCEEREDMRYKQNPQYVQNLFNALLEEKCKDMHTYTMVLLSTIPDDVESILPFIYQEFQKNNQVIALIKAYTALYKIKR